MFSRYCLLVLICTLSAGCAGNKAVPVPDGEYVEIENPGYTMSPNAPPTIIVPRRYVESGVPRGSELVREGYEAAKSSLAGTQQPAQKPLPAVAAPVSAPSPAAAAPVPIAAPGVPTPAVKGRIAVLEIGKNGLVAALSDSLRKASAGVVLDSAQTAFLARYAATGTQAERSTFSARLQEDFGANLVVFVSAPDGIFPGKAVQAEVYDALGGGLPRTVDVLLAPYAASDRAAKDAAVAAALQKLTAQIKEIAILLPWYGKVVAVEGDRVYINAGKEAGVHPGLVLKIFKAGKIVKGLGFAPGKRVGVLEVSGYVGANGAYGVLKEGSGVESGDLVTLE